MNKCCQELRVWLELQWFQYSTLHIKSVIYSVQSHVHHANTADCAIDVYLTRQQEGRITAVDQRFRGRMSMLVRKAEGGGLRRESTVYRDEGTHVGLVKHAHTT